MFNFIIDCTDAALKEYLSIRPEEYATVFTKGDLNWCLQTFFILSRRGRVPVHCSNRLQENKINVIHSDQLLKLRGSTGNFAVCVRADHPSRPWAHYHLVQNVNQLSFNTSYIPHWVQPGLIKRSTDRKGVSRVAYAGAPIRGNFAGTADSWRKLFESHGIEFVLLPSGSWHDLSKVDVLVGIRSFGTQPYNTKPPTKLFNAWHASIPFVGGSDSAFKEVGVPGEDYLLARSPEEVVAAVLQLRDNPALYAALVQRGQQKAQLYSEQKIAEVWEGVLQGPIMQRYEQWKKRPAYEQVRFQFLQEIGLLENNGKQLIKSILNGITASSLIRRAVSR